MQDSYKSPEIFKERVEKHSHHYSPPKSGLKKSARSNYSSKSSGKCRLFMDSNEKAQMEKLSLNQYQEHMNQYRNKEGMTQDYYKDYQKSILIKKSILEVQKKAQELKQKRLSPKRYENVQSKVNQCIKVQNRSQKRKSYSRNRQVQGIQTTLNFNQSFASISNQKSLTGSISDIKKDKKSMTQTQNKKRRGRGERNNKVNSSKDKEIDIKQNKREKKIQGDNNKEDKKVEKNKLSQEIDQFYNKYQLEEEKKKEKIEVSSKKQLIFSEGRKIENIKDKQISHQIHTLEEMEDMDNINQKNYSEHDQIDCQINNNMIKQNTGFKSKQQEPYINNYYKDNQFEEDQIYTQQDDQINYQQQSENEQLQESFGIPVHNQIEGNSSLYNQININKHLSNQIEQRNQELSKKTQELQNEFDSLLQEMKEKKHLSIPKEKLILTDQNIAIPLYNFDYEKHQSPTRRLITHKNSTFKHKQVMKDNIQRQDYSLTYCPSPGKSYIIEPHGGELKYQYAEKNPKKFYDQVFNQDITKHSVRPNKEIKRQRSLGSKQRVPLEIKSKITKRPLFMIYQKIVLKLMDKMKYRIGYEYMDDIKSALEDPSIDRQIKYLMKGGHIQLINERNQAIYSKQIQLAGLKLASNYVESDQKGKEYDSDEEQEEYLDEGSPLLKSKTQLGMQGKDLEKIEKDVREHIRRNSKRPINKV